MEENPNILSEANIAMIHEDESQIPQKTYTTISLINIGAKHPKQMTSSLNPVTLKKILHYDQVVCMCVNKCECGGQRTMENLGCCSLITIHFVF